jgi:hypothetical protein
MKSSKARNDLPKSAQQRKQESEDRLRIRMSRGRSSEEREAVMHRNGNNPPLPPETPPQAITGVAAFDTFGIPAWDFKEDATV